MAAGWNTARWGVLAALAVVATACSDSGSSSVANTAVATTALAPTTTAAPTTVPPTTVPPTTGAPVAEVIAADGWNQAADGAPWGGRAGLRVVALGEPGAQQLFVIAGRTPKQSSIPGASDLWGDVWRSDDLGITWAKVLDSGAAFSPRAYFQALVHKGSMYVIGGQDFKFPQSSFYNDVWRSADGVAWEQTTPAAPWVGRAGLMAASFGDFIYVFGGSKNDDAAIIGPTGPVREYFNDVWRSTDGVEWEKVTASAPWSPRAGGAVAVHEGALYLLGGEVGFICQPYPGCDPPYFNDVWRTTDGVKWKRMTERADWSPRPGHQCESIAVGGAPTIVCFGGFGQGENPIDVWTSVDGASWALTDSKPWNATVPEQGRYDFDSTVVTVPHSLGPVPAIITVGGDRETFDFGDPDNWLRVDDDVWWFVLPTAGP